MRHPKRPIWKNLVAAALAVGILHVSIRPAHAVDDLVLFLNSPTAPVGYDPAAYFHFGSVGGFSDFNRAGNPLSPQGGNYALVIVDTNADWGGGGIAFTGGALGNGQRAVNLQEFEGGQLKFYLRSGRDLQVEIQYGTAFNVTASQVVDVPTVGFTGGPQGNGWHEVTIPLASFGSVDFTSIRVPFLIKIPFSYASEPGDIHTEIYLDHIRWVAPSATEPVLRPGSTRVNPGGRRQFLISNAVGPTITDTPSNLGTFNVATGNEVIFTAGGTIQSGTVNAEKDGFTGTASVQVTNANLNQETGIVTEVIPTVLGSSANIFPYAAVNSTVTLHHVNGDMREGSFSVRSDITVETDEYAGWAVEWLSGSANLNEYFDGSVRFWFKATANLNRRVHVTVRSDNVAPGGERKIWLDQLGVSFNNTWQSVVIPVDSFAGTSPKVDLSRVKVLFNIAVSSRVNGGEFFIDNLRWDSRKPGVLHHIDVVPGNVSIPKNLKQTFVAKGFDVNNVPVDIWPTWNAGSLGTLSTTQGDATRLTAAASPVSGNLTATHGGITGTAVVSVTNVTFTQSLNVYTDAGAGGQVGVDPNDGSISLTEITPGGAPEGAKIMRANYSLSGINDYATWFVYEQFGSKFLNSFSQGYLNFFIKTTRDLEISIRSDNVPPGTNRAKVRLSTLGVPTNGTWQEVWLSLNDFKLLEPNLDFAQIKVFFGVAALQAQIGNVSDQEFDIDAVRWYTANPEAPDVNKVYEGLKGKQVASGLVISFDNDGLTRAVTYDQALAAMAYTYHQDTALAKKVFDVYKGKYGTGAGFAGFHEEYQAVNPSLIRDHDRTVGPNAFLALALLHYKAVTGSTEYDAMIMGIANWIKGLQDPDGGIRYGFLGETGTPSNNKSTEHNMDAYALYRSVAALMGDASFDTEASQVLTYLTTEMWTGTRFRVGETAGGVAVNDRALDVYSWAPLALSSFTSVVGLAEADFGVTKNNDTTGVMVEGFDFSGMPSQAVDKDAVWLEGTAQMVLAYLHIENTERANHYLNELEKAIYVSGVGQQALTYATNAGTAYGFTMDSTHGAISSMAWYLFSKRGFNPFQPIQFFSFEVRRISDNALVGGNITWSTNMPARWTRAQQYVKLRMQSISQAAWGVQIYTDNQNPSAALRYVDPTPGITINPDSSPAGLLRNLGQPTTSEKLDLSWRIQGTTNPVPNAIAPFTLGAGGAGEAFNWFFMKDRSTPAIDSNGDGSTGGGLDGTPFTPGEDYMVIMNNDGVHASQGPAGYVPDIATQFLYFQADFTPAAAQVNYTAPIILEAFFE